MKLLIRNICKAALDDAKGDFAHQRQRIETSFVDDRTIQIKLFGPGNPPPSYLTVTVKGSI